PNEFVLEQNYPNPFNPSTKIRYSIPTPPSSSPLIKERNEVGFVTLKVYDVLGNEVAILVNEQKPAGTYEVEFNLASSNKHLASGTYFYQLTAGSFLETKKMIYLK
ncbi:MAG: T9SS type A sorting domain-containing protein, partial [Ignavibacteriaceae bacterium]|nr:T9SS type A sorting domain-containing protein [Ignavibacteriaceae bacterium]